MVAKREAGSKDSFVRFSQIENTGVFIQHQFSRALLIVKGIREDEFSWLDGYKASELEKWIESKRKAFKEQEAHATAPQV